MTRMTQAEVAQVLVLVQERLRFKPGAAGGPITPITVKVWKQDFDAANCGHYHLMEQAVSNFFASDEAKYGVTPQSLIAAYKQITRKIAERVPGWESLTYEERQEALGASVEAGSGLTAVGGHDRAGADVAGRVEARTGIRMADVGRMDG